MSHRPRIPRITIGRLLVAVIPISAYMSLFRFMMFAFPAGVPLAAALIAALLALSGLAVAAYRRATFAGAVIQMTTTPLVIFAISGTVRASNRFEQGLGIGIAWGWFLIIVVATIRFLYFMAWRRHSTDPAPPPPGHVGLVIESIGAALANLGLLCLPLACCMSVD